jgi:hypothetical protein
MLRQIIAATTIALCTLSAHAGDSIVEMGSSAKPNSVAYVGYDSFDAKGNPICTPCIAKRAEEAAKLQAYAERRERSREYMAKLQGNSKEPDSMIAANASELPAGAKPSPENPAADITATPLRASGN